MNIPEFISVLLFGLIVGYISAWYVLRAAIVKYKWGRDIVFRLVFQNAPWQELREWHAMIENVIDYND